MFQRNFNNSLATVTNLNIESPTPSIFKLSIDCFHEIFDWLSQRDLIAVGQTCKHLQRIAGDFVYYNYAVKTARGDGDGIYISSVRSNVFSQYIQKLSISGDRLKAYQYVSANCTNSIKYFRAYGILPEGAFECIKHILKGVEMLEMNDCVINGEFYENYLRYCPNIKNLSISRSSRIRNRSVIIGSGNDWLLRSYPKLENLELVDLLYKMNHNELKTFFQQNPNLKSFSTDSRTLLDNRQSIIEANLSLDTFCIEIFQTKNLDSVYDLLWEMHEKGLYRRLHLYMLFNHSQSNISKFSSLNAIETIYGDIVRIERVMYGVRSIGIWCGDEIENLDGLPFNIPYVKRIYFSKISSNRISPFIRHSPRLKEIRIRDLKGDFRDVDLATLNEERKKLVGAQKVGIYVKEDAYLSMKWAAKTVEFSLIELRRFDSAEWEELNSKAKYFKSQ